MADHLTEQPRAEILAPVTTRGEVMRTRATPWLIVAVLVALAGWLFWKAFLEREEGDPVGSAMLAFSKQNSLTVFSSRFEVVAESTNSRGVLGIELVKSRQAAIIPATVEYRLDLANMDRDRFAWNADTQTLAVRLPVLRISRPNLDEAQARTFTEGSFVTGSAAQALAKNNSVQAERRADAFAKNPEVLALARQAAKEAVRQNLAIPLQVAGYKDASVTVTFDGETP